jgi:hypothetical protein
VAQFIGKEAGQILDAAGIYEEYYDEEVSPFYPPGGCSAWV